MELGFSLGNIIVLCHGNGVFPLLQSFNADGIINVLKTL